MQKFLLNDEDLKVILNVDQDTILDMVADGMPHFYYKDHFFFNYKEVQEWILEALELGFIETQFRGTANYIRETLKEELNPETLKKELRRYMQQFRGLSDSKLVWLYNNCGGDKYMIFRKYVEKCFPGVKQRYIYKYYLALLQTLIDSGTYKDTINKEFHINYT